MLRLGAPPTLPVLGISYKLRCATLASCAWHRTNRSLVRGKHRALQRLLRPRLGGRAVRDAHSACRRVAGNRRLGWVGHSRVDTVADHARVQSGRGGNRRQPGAQLALGWLKKVPGRLSGSQRFWVTKHIQNERAKFRLPKRGFLRWKLGHNEPRCSLCQRAFVTRVV
jgi:hypothetical protein